MWDQWKEKIKNLFLREVDESEDDPQFQTDRNRNEYKHQHVQTRVTYQYPNKKSFRFPVIPDETEKQSDIPAYKRERKINRGNTNTNTNTNEVNPEPKPPKPEKKEKKVFKNHNQPFQPTEVASPIYGYQKRKDKEVENVPAFIRKQQDTPQKTEEQTATDDHKENHEPEYTAVHPIEIAPEPIIVEQEQGYEVTAEKLEDNHEQSIAEEIVMDEPAATVESPVQYHEESVKNVHPDKKDEEVKEVKPKEKQEGPKQVPFNVIMTPLDKKKLMDKKRAEQKLKEQQKQMVPEQPSKPLPYHLLNDPEQKSNDDQLWVSDQQELLEETLKHFNVRAKVVNATQGPSVTRFEVQPELGVKVSKVRNLSDDLKLNMAARDIRIEAPIPGKNTIGIEVPNLKPQMVGLQEIFETEPFKQSTSPLTIALGLSVEELPMITNISKMQHGLIAGATGSGKSVCINTILISLLYKANHQDVKFLLIDPKMVELAPYNGIPHLVSPVITDVKAATAALKWAVNEMEERYEKFVQEGVRDIERFNQKMKKQDRLNEKMPFIVIVIDELADLMMISPQDVEDAISRIAQKARACGMHLLVATQRPSVDVITGLIKANIPTRIAFSVSSQVDSRTIIDNAGAEKLLGKGDMLFVENGAGKSIRLQGAFVSDEEIERVTNHARSIAPANYLFEQEQLLEQMAVDEEEDVLLHQAIEFVLNQNSASTSLLQRQFKIGYNRAARLIDTLENRGIISQQNGSKPRDVLVSKAQMEELH